MRGPAVLLTCAAALTAFALLFAATFEAQYAAMTIAVITTITALLLAHEHRSGEG